MTQVTWTHVGIAFTIDLIIWTAKLVVYVLYIVDPASTETFLPPPLATAALVIAIVNTLSAIIRLTLWEYLFGNAFAYFYPQHNARRIDDFTWRFGVYERTNFVTALTLLVLRVLFTLTFTFALEDVLLFTPFTPLQVLLASIATIFILAVLMLFVLAGQFYTGSLAYYVEKAQ